MTNPITKLLNPTDITALPQINFVEAISKFKQDTDFYIKESSGLTITDDLTYRQAVKAKKEITSYINQVAKDKTVYTKPYRDAIQSFYDTVEATIEPLKFNKANLTNNILNYETELEKQRLAEEKRINDLATGFVLAINKIPNTIKECEEVLEKTNNYFKSLNTQDQKNPNILESANNLFLAITDKIKFLENKVEQEKREAELKVITDKQELEKKQIEIEKNEIEKQRLANIEEMNKKAIQEEIDRQKQIYLNNEKANQDLAPKTGIRTYTKFRIIDPLKVPRKYCVPSDSLINEAKKQGITEIPGVKFYTETK